MLQDPRECSECRNVFCSKCIQLWQNSQNLFSQVCPLRCKQVTIMKCSIPFRHQLDNLRVKCRNRDCNEDLKVAQILLHENTCPMELVSCENGQCSKKLFRKEVQEHQADCQYRPVACNHCQQLVAIGSLPFHEEEVCWKYIIKCKKCQLELERGAMMSHLDFECAENEIKCNNYPRCNVKMKKRDQEAHSKDECPFTLIAC